MAQNKAHCLHKSCKRLVQYYHCTNKHNDIEKSVDNNYRYVIGILLTLTLFIALICGLGGI